MDVLLGGCRLGDACRLVIQIHFRDANDSSVVRSMEAHRVKVMRTIAMHIDITESRIPSEPLYSSLLILVLILRSRFSIRSNPFPGACLGSFLSGNITYTHLDIEPFLKQEPDRHVSLSSHLPEIPF